MEIGNIEFNHSEKIQMRFNDIDVLGHVNNAVQITYFDFGKVKYFEALKDQIIDWSGADLVMVHFEVDFIEPIFRENSIVVKTKVYEIGNKSIKLIQILQDKISGRVKSVCKSVMCGFDTKTNKGLVISDEWRELIQKFESFHP